MTGDYEEIKDCKICGKPFIPYQDCVFVNNEIYHSECYHNQEARKK